MGVYPLPPTQSFRRDSADITHSSDFEYKRTVVRTNATDLWHGSKKNRGLLLVLREHYPALGPDGRQPFDVRLSREVLIPRLNDVSSGD